MKELLVESKIENLDAVLDFINGALESCSMKVRNQLNIAVDEIFSNVARYAYQPKTGDIVIRIAVADDIVVEFEDAGVPFNPLSEDNPDTSLSVDERDIGGLGIFMVKNIMDTVEYRHEEGKNILTVRKKLIKE